MDKSVIGWLKQKRLEAELDLKQLAKRASINPSQISRIETGKSELSLNSLVVLLWALKIDPEEFIKTFSLPPLLPSPPSFGLMLFPRQDCVHISLALNFISKYRDNLPEAISIVVEKMFPAVEKANTDDLTVKNLQEKVRDAVLQGKLLPAPPGITLEHLYINYANDLVVTMADAGLYLQLWRHKRQWGLEKLAAESSVNKSTIHRLENNQSDRISLDAAVSLERALEAGGHIFSMFWAASKIQVGIAFSNDKERPRRYQLTKEMSYLLDAYVKAARWTQVYTSPHNRQPKAVNIADIMGIDDPGEQDAYLKSSTKDGKHLIPNPRHIPILALEVSEWFSLTFMITSSEIFTMVGEDIIKKIPFLSPEIRRTLSVWVTLREHVGNDLFGKQLMDLYIKNHRDSDYRIAFRVLLRELMKKDYVFYDKMVEFVKEKERHYREEEQKRRESVLDKIRKKANGEK